MKNEQITINKEYLELIATIAGYKLSNIYIEKEIDNSKIKVNLIGFRRYIDEAINSLVGYYSKFEQLNYKNLEEYYLTSKNKFESLNLNYDNIRNPIYLDEIMKSLKEYKKSIDDLNFNYYFNIQKEEMFDSLQYVLSKEDLNIYKRKFDKLLNNENFNISEAKELFNKLNNIIIQGFKKNITDIKNYKPGEPFKFICHTTDAYEWRDEPNVNFVSTSMLTDKIRATFRSNYGFLFDPKDIIASASYDIGTVNTAITEEKSLYQTISKFYSVGKLENDYKINLENGDTNPYNEIVINGFNPIGLFCYTFGLKEIESNYRNIKNIQKSFPNLDLVEIDATLYCEKEKLDNCKQRMLIMIKEYISKERISENTTFDLERYNLFFDTLNKLKQTNNYTVEDVINGYNNNNFLISIAMYSDKLFASNLSKDQIKYALLYGYNYNVYNILSGNFNDFHIYCFQNSLLRYKDNKLLLELFPGIDLFLDILSNIDLTEKNVEIIKNKKYSNFIDLSKSLISIIELKRNEITIEKIGLKNEELKLQRQLEIENKEFNKQNYFNEIVNYEFSYELAKTDITDLEHQINLLSIDNEFKTDEYETKIQILNVQKSQLIKAQKHKIINRKKIKFLQADIDELNNKIESITNELSVIDFNLEQKNTEIKNIKTNFEKKYKIKYDDFLEKFEIAKNNLDFDLIYNLEKNINEIKEKLQKTNESILDLNNKTQIMTSIINEVDESNVDSKKR